MIDQRGTGRSNPLLCPKLALPPTEPMLPPQLVRECRKSLQAKSDLRFYGTVDAVEDLDAVRRALGYTKIDLFGLSYGSTVALRYMQRHPSAVRAAVLMGTAPPSLLPPQRHATAGARALDLMFEDCARRPACTSLYPSLRGDLTRAMARLAKPDAPISGELFIERLRAMLYSPAGRATVPRIIARAARGDLSPLLKRSPDTGGAVADGMFLAITCGESFPLMNYERAASAARNTLFGDYRLRRQRAACQGWPRVRLDPQHLRLPDADIPVLLVSGNMDPVTPPGLAEAVARHLPRARHLVLAEGGHVPDGLTGLEECLDPLMIAFLDHADLAKLDTSCVAGMKAPAYVAPQETSHE
jgi:pimeloyl-ACP methyl ester carboxylesterase